MAFSSSIEQIARVLHSAHVYPDTGSEVVCRGVVTDSREVVQGSMYVARRGENVDGHDFIDSAFENGANACLVSNTWLNSTLADAGERNRIFIAVDDTTIALGQLASYWREQLNIPTIALTGSNGKTTTKEMVGVILRNLVGPGTANEKSFNNHVGLPLTILKADTNSRWLLLEAGMNHAGELDLLGAIAKPDVVVVLNVGAAHMGFFNSIGEIADAKCELIAHVSPPGKCVINGDDIELRSAIERLGKRKKQCFAEMVKFGTSEELDFFSTKHKVLGLKGLEFVINHAQSCYKASIPHIGAHNISNAVAAVAICSSVFHDLGVEDIVSALNTAPVPPMRLQVIKAGAYSIINDAYNANPVSMLLAFEAAASLVENSSCDCNSFGVVVGDMLELGEASADLHRKMGREAAESGAGKLVAIGQFAEMVVQGAKEAGLENSSIARDSTEAADIFINSLSPNIRTVLVKGSRGMELENVVEILIKKLNVIPSPIFSS